MKLPSLPIVASTDETRWLRGIWPLYIVIGLLFGAYMAMNDVLQGELYSPHFRLWHPFVRNYSSVLILFALIPLIVRLESRFRLDARPRTPVILVHSAGALLFSLLHVAVAYPLRIAVYHLAGEAYVIDNPFITLLYETQKTIILYVFVLLVSFAVREFRVRRANELRAVRLTAELGEARLRHLTAQVDPHFLFNALNAISNRMREDLDAADRMIAQLGDLLRAAYGTDQHLFVSLGSELQWLRGYTGMMAERFRGQLNLELDIDPTLESVEVPRLLLQPLVENSIRHGLAEGRGNLSVQVAVTAHACDISSPTTASDCPPLRCGMGRDFPTWRDAWSSCFRVITSSVLQPAPHGVPL
jgi:signal transduction histidine kinase